MAQNNQKLPKTIQKWPKTIKKYSPPSVGCRFSAGGGGVFFNCFRQFLDCFRQFLIVFSNFLVIPYLACI